jgi:glycosyltransferase involved in cell wall biosynthesis
LQLARTNFAPNEIVVTRSPHVVRLLTLRGVATIYECHDWFPRRSAFRVGLVRDAHRIVVTNSFIKAKFVEYRIAAEKIIVAPNGADEAIFALEISVGEAQQKLSAQHGVSSEIWAASQTRILYTGSFKTKGIEKGIETILRALALLDDSYCLYAVGGNATDIAQYTRMAEELGVASRAKFFGRHEQSALALFQRACDIMCMPFPKLAHYEYFMSPLKTFEYMLSGLPIIASTLPSITEILSDDTAFFVTPNDERGLAKMLASIRDNPDAAAQKAARAREAAKKYTWSLRAATIGASFM